MIFPISQETSPKYHNLLPSEKYFFSYAMRKTYKNNRGKWIEWEDTMPQLLYILDMKRANVYNVIDTLSSEGLIIHKLDKKKHKIYPLPWWSAICVNQYKIDILIEKQIIKEI